MKRIKILIVLLLIALAPIYLHSQCNITAYANGTSNAISICPGDAVTLTSTGGCPTYVMNNDFNNGTPGLGWSATNQAMFNKPCTPHSPDGTIYMWMGSTSAAPRILTTVPFDVSQGGTIEFQMRYAIQSHSSPCEGPDLYHEGIAVEYSINNGSSWTTIQYYAPNGNVLTYVPSTSSPGISGQTPFTVWTTRTVTIPAAAQTTATRFRWAQKSSSGSGWDHWGLDNVKIIVPPPTISVWWDHGPTTYDPPTLNPTSSTTYTVHISDGGSTVQSSVQVTVNPTPTSTFNSPSELCEGEAGLFTYTGNAGTSATYNWDFDGGTIISGTGKGPYYVSWPNAGTYNISLSVFENGCNSLATTIPVIVNPNPVPIITPANPLICAGSTITLDAGSYNSYNWSTGSTSQSVTVSQTGNYAVTVTDTKNCTGSSSTTVNVAPLITFAHVDTNILCNGGNNGSITLNTGGGVPPFSYNWSSSVSNSNYASNLTAGTYNITITDDNSCDTTLSVTLTEPSAIVLNVSNDTTVCMGQTATITANATGGVSPYSYEWDNGLGIGQSHSVTVSSTITYSVTVTDANNCVVGPESVVVNVYPDLNINLAASPTSICEGAQTILTANATGGNGGPYNYAWSNGQTTQADNIAVSPNITTTFTVTVTDNCGTPPAESSVVVTIFPTPQPVFSADVIDGCAPLSVNFTDLTGSGIQSWSWDFGDVQSGNQNSSNSQNPAHLFSESGSYDITLNIITDDGCKNTTTLNNMITVYANPVALFSATPNPASTTNPTVTFYDQSVNASVWLWNFNDVSSSNSISILQNPIHNFSASGFYNVTLTVLSPQGCIDSTSSIVGVTEDFSCWMPNAFSPNEDGINDIFSPKGVSIDPDTYEMYIYDRWGEEVFSTRDINHGWNGRIKNGDKVAQPGVYTWIIKFSKLNGMKYIDKGIVTLIK